MMTIVFQSVLHSLLMLAPALDETKAASVGPAALPKASEQVPSAATDTAPVSAITTAPPAPTPSEVLKASKTVGLIGFIHISKGPASKTLVSLRYEDKAKPMIALRGELLDELRHLHSAHVEVIGTQAQGDEAFDVMSYRILDLGGGVKPLVGVLVPMGEGVGLRDGEGTPIGLSASPVSKARFLRSLGSKIWVHGKKLVSGELQVLRYGILKEQKTTP